MRIQDVLNDAQGGQAFANLARAFHLPPGKVDVAVGAMIDELVDALDERLRTRRTLAKIVKLLGKPAYEHILESPALLGATHTQVLGSEALAVIAGHAAADKISRRAAAVANISEMIAEYLLPVIAGMLVGALARLSRPGFDALLGNATDIDAAPALPAQLQLPNVSGGYGFTGSTSGSGGVVGPDTTTAPYAELSEVIKRSQSADAAADPADAVRALLADSLDLPHSGLDWMSRIQKWSYLTLNAMFAGWRR